MGKTKEFGHVWTDKFIEFLKEGTYSSRQLANIMGCDPNTIRKKANELNMNYFVLGICYITMPKNCLKQYCLFITNKNQLNNLELEDVIIFLKLLLMTKYLCNYGRYKN